MRRLTRRRALSEALAGAGGMAFAIAGCGGAGDTGIGATGGPAASGSTLRATWRDPVGDGQLRLGPGEALADRIELGPRSAVTETLTTLAHITDAHVLDASSPARVGFLDRLGAPFQSTFRPQETLTAQVLAGIVNAVRALEPELVIQGGDLIDNAQANELQQALVVLRGGRVAPGSGRAGYFGVQSARDTDPFYYRPDVDAPRHPGLLRAAVRPFSAPGAGTPVYPVLGDHDALVAGEVVPTAVTRSLALGDRALWDLPPGLSLPPGTRTSAIASPDGPPDPGLVDYLLARALAGPTISVPPDRTRRELSFAEIVVGLRASSGPATARSAQTDRLDYTLDAGPRVRLIVLDIVRRGGGSGGLVAGDQPAWLAHELARAGDRWVIFVTHQPLETSTGGDALLTLLDSAPRVIATLSGHTHRNRIRPRPTRAGGYWQISTASLIDYPQQGRALRVVATADRGVAIQTWMLDHVTSVDRVTPVGHVTPGELGTISRELSYIDAQGGRPKRFAGTRLDRNVTLYRGPAAYR